jgi:hypothetical protein
MNLWHLERNLARAQLCEDPDYPKVPSDDEDYPEELAPKPSTPFTQTALGWKMTQVATFLKTLTPTTRKIVEKLTGEDAIKATQEQSSASTSLAGEEKLFMSAKLS